MLLVPGKWCRKVLQLRPQEKDTRERVRSSEKRVGVTQLAQGPSRKPLSELMPEHKDDVEREPLTS